MSGAQDLLPGELVVGVDGSPPSERALERAVRALQGRVGTLRVVFVNHVGPAALSPLAVAELAEAADQAEADVRARVADLIGDQPVSWTFDRRDGDITDQILAVADEVAATSGPDQVLIVVGRAARALHHVVGSVPVGLVHRSRYAVLIVP